MILGLLASGGPRHGHQLRRNAEVTSVGEWGGVHVGALYRELKNLAAEGLVEPLRTEQVAQRPARTIYRITETGEAALKSLRERAIRDLHFGPDAFGVAVLFGRTWKADELAALLRARRGAIEEALAGLSAESRQLSAAKAIGPLDLSLFRRRSMQLEAELRWQQEFEIDLLRGGLLDESAQKVEPETAASPEPDTSPGKEIP
jgi:DNA-binding PadR family transcriptional regulator